MGVTCSQHVAILADPNFDKSYRSNSMKLRFIIILSRHIYMKLIKYLNSIEKFEPGPGFQPRTSRSLA